jgi:hypothetical protein
VVAVLAPTYLGAALVLNTLERPQRDFDYAL